VATANHRERICAIEDGRARNGGDGLLAGINEICIGLALAREGANAQQAILGLEPDLYTGGHMVGHQRWNANSQVHIKTISEFLGGPRGHLVSAPGHG